MYMHSHSLWTLQALAPIGALFGSFLGGFSADSFGRKAALLMVAIPYLIGYLIIAYTRFFSSTSSVGFLSAIFCGRFFTGVGLGWSCLAVPVSC